MFLHHSAEASLHENLTNDFAFPNSGKIYSSFLASVGSESRPSLLFTSSETPVMGTNGNDYISMPGITDDTLLGLEGADTLLSHGGVDFLYGGAGADFLYGGDLADWLYGDGGDDTLQGENGWDVLYADNEAGIAGDDESSRNLLLGGDGGDLLFGSLGFDTLCGGNDEDTLVGEQGADWLHGGAGADLFLIDLSRNSNLVSSFAAGDTIVDFSAAEGDTLSLGLRGGMLTGLSGPAPLVWRGSLLAPGGPVPGVALPGEDLGAAYLQAWLLLPSIEPITNEGWIIIDLDQDGLLGASDVIFRLQASGLSSGLVFGATEPESIFAWAGNAAGDILEARVTGSRLLGLGGADVLLGAVGNDWLSGGDDEDTLAGDGGDDQLWGGAGNDWLLGGNGNDALYADAPGGAGPDNPAATNRLEGEAGNDSLYGGHGSDVLLGGLGDDFLDGNGGADTLQGGFGDDTLLGGVGADSLIGGSGTDSLDGGDGNDTIVFGDITDSLDGGDGLDWLVISGSFLVNLGIGGNQVSGASWATRFEAVDARSVTGGVTLLGSQEDNRLIAGLGSSSMSGQGGDDILQGGAGNDTLVGGLGLNLLAGGAGDDLYVVSGSDDLVLEAHASGSDTIIAMLDFYLAPETEVLILAEGSGAIRGGGGLGDDRLIGNGNGNELLGGDGNDTLEGGDGADTLEGGDQDDILIGGNCADMLSGDSGDDSLDGGTGNDTLSGGEGADTLAGATGDDLYLLDSADDLVLENLALGKDTVVVAFDFWLPPEVEVLVLASGTIAILGGGGPGDDRLIGNANANKLLGGDGDDTLDGGAGADTLEGGEQDDLMAGGDQADLLLGGAGLDSLDGGADSDTLVGGANADTMSGGSGDDLYLIVDPEDLVIEEPEAGQDTVITMSDLLMPSHVEVLIIGESASDLYLIGTAFDDIMIGNGLGNRFESGAGNDVILAGRQSLTDILAMFGAWA